MDRKDVTIVDVSTPMEFASGHVVGAVNVPLLSLMNRIGELKQLRGKIVLCCPSGVRSHRALELLSRSGMANVYDGGTWQKVESYISNLN